MKPKVNPGTGCFTTGRQLDEIRRHAAILDFIPLSACSGSGVSGEKLPPPMAALTWREIVQANEFTLPAHEAAVQHRFVKTAIG
jgi:hypothetical protein